jgi:3',5'-cyclic AMP phosphodiesterase CpdA
MHIAVHISCPGPEAIESDASVTPKKLIQISDLHLSRTRAYTYRNWKAILDHIHDVRPELVINTGDFVLDAPEDVDDLAYAYQQMQRLKVAWKALPGDHDIGGGPPSPLLRSDVPWLEHYASTEQRRAQYLDIFGEDRWALPFGDWYLIGVNDLIFESGFAAEDSQWQFLAEQLMIAASRPTALFMHKPPCVTSIDEDAYLTNAIPAQARRRLHDMLKEANVQLIGTGHLHVYRTFHTMGITVVTAPTILRGEGDYVSHNGLDVNGLVEYSFDGEGVEFRLVQPDGIARPRFPMSPRKDWPPLPVEDLT